MCGPRGLPFARNHLFHNEGGGKFIDVSTTSGVGRTTGLLRLHGRRVGLRRGRISGPVRRLRLDAKPAVSQQEERHVRGHRAVCGRRAERRWPGAGRDGRGGGRLRRGRPYGHPEDELQRRRAEPVSQQRRRHLRGSRVPVRAGRLHGVRRLGCAFLWTWITMAGRICCSSTVMCIPRSSNARKSTTASRACCTGTSAAAGSRISRRRPGPASRRRAVVARLRRRRSRQRRIARGRDRATWARGRPCLKNFGNRRKTGCSCSAPASAPIVMPSARASSSRSAGRRVSGEVQSGAGYISQNDSRLHFGLGDQRLV